MNALSWLCRWSLLCLAALPTAAQGPGEAMLVAAPRRMTLEECVQFALDNNRRRLSSRWSLVAAEAGLRQALASYWPQAGLQAGWSRRDESVDFLFPASRIVLPSQTLSIPASTALVSLPAGALGPGFPSTDVAVPVQVPATGWESGPQVIPIPEQQVRVLNPQMVSAGLRLDWLLFDGGMRNGLVDQARAGVALARAELRRTELEIAGQVRRYYYAAVLAGQLCRLGQETLGRLEASLELTESLYQNGAGTVTRADYLETLAAVETARALLAGLERNQSLTRAALATSMGLSWDSSVEPAEDRIPVQRFQGDPREMVAAAYEFNPDWEKIESALKALEGEVQAARSPRLPKVGLTGRLAKWWNGETSGLATPQNRTSWEISLGAEFALFDGGLTAGRIAEARARLEKLKQEKLLLKEGLGLALRDLFLTWESAWKASQAAARAAEAATENRRLLEQAYQDGLTEAERLIRAQFLEGLMSAQEAKYRYDCAVAESQVAVVVGKAALEAVNRGR